jgi:signal transduction histidine kinase
VSPLATSVFACAGVSAYVALYYGALYALRRAHVEHATFASLCACLSLFAFSTGLTMRAGSVAQAVGAQHAQLAALVLACAFFVDFVLRLINRPEPKTMRAIYVASAVSACAAMARLFFDPAHASPNYDWAGASPRNVALAELSPIGIVCTSGLVCAAAYAIVRLFLGARGKPELRVAAIVTGIGLAAGFADLVVSLFDLVPYHLSAHATLLPVIGGSYVLASRFTQVDVELADRKEELARSYDHLRVAHEELVRTEQLAAVGELSAVIAHEVRNPLAIIKNAATGLRRIELPKDDAETLLRILDEETDRLNRLVNDLLAYAKPIAPEAGQVDLRKLVMHAVELAAGGHHEISQIELELELDRAVDLVEGDETLLRHALINIVDNALQAMPTGGTLTITCRNASVEGRPSVAVDFHDTGEGMDTLVRSRARDPFFTTRQSGTGLGLAIVDRVARVHGGRVEIESRHGQGTTISFVVPRERSSIAPSTS